MTTNERTIVPNDKLNNNTEQNKISMTGNFIIGGLAGCASQIVSHPMDVMKIHMQISNSSFYVTINETIKHGGIHGFYIGLRAAIFRQITYSTTRLGFYHGLLDYFEDQFGRLKFPTLIALGMISGAIGSFVGTPADLIMIRMISDVKYSPELQWKYKNSLSGILDIINNEGFFKLWRGAVPSMGRAAIVNGINLGSYTSVKMGLLDTGFFGPGIPLQLSSSLLSSVITSIISHPIDLAKTKIQNWHGTTQPGMIKLLLIISKNNGFLSLWRGVLPYYLRGSMNTAILMITMEQLQSLYHKIIN